MDFQTTSAAGLFGSGFDFAAYIAHSAAYGVAAFFNGFLGLVGYVLGSFFGFIPVAAGVIFRSGPSAGTGRQDESCGSQCKKFFHNVFLSSDK
ncbi:hypothetical protein NEISICOT_03352 [Neisseria sicca ATCC 29256]|uniref:Uncharacterized protein n=1 Tax=Neisseria sicca ATCC 29256 TaxID=547045 RepID=C6M9X1_NEISI|nr:hypothetical protein NEISICOT_03352 [Neisseria sicca ATCC 29256]